MVIADKRTFVGFVIQEFSVIGCNTDDRRTGRFVGVFDFCGNFCLCGHFLDTGHNFGNHLGVVHRQPLGKLGPHFFQFFIRELFLPHNDVVDTKVLVFGDGFPLGPFPDRKHGYDRGNTENDAQHGEERPELMFYKARDGHAYVFLKLHLMRFLSTLFLTFPLD